MMDNYDSCNVREQTGWISINGMVEELWMWCMNSEITIIVEHLPGILNTIADEESRLIKGRSDWMLIFRKFQQRLGPLEVDIFVCQPSLRDSSTGN